MASLTHIAGRTCIHALSPGVADTAALEVVSTRPPHLGHTLTASISRDRLILTGGVAGAEYEVRGLGVDVLTIRAVHQDGHAQGQPGGSLASVTFFDVPPVGPMIGAADRAWRPGLFVVQSPGANRPWGFDYTSQARELGAGVVLVESTWHQADGLEADDLGHDGTRTGVRAHGGQDGEDYDLTNRVRFSDGTIDGRTIQVRIRRQ